MLVQMIYDLMPKMADDAGQGGGGEPASNTNPVNPAADQGLQNTGEATVSMTPQAEAQPQTPDFKALVPEEYQDKPYIQDLLKNENPQKAFFKQFDNLQKKLGERPDGVPGENATEEEWGAFWSSLGKPSDVEGYDYELPEVSEDDKPVLDFIQKNRSPEFEKELKELAFKNNMPKKMWEAMSKGFDELSIKHNKDLLRNAAQAEAFSDKSFDDYANEKLGADKEKILAIGNKMLKEHTSPELMQELSAVAENKALVLFASALNSIYQKYGAEDTFGASAQSAGATRQSISEEGRKILAHPAMQDPFHPQHEEMQRKAKEHYAQLKPR